MHTTPHTPATIQKMREANLNGTYGFKKGERRSPTTEFKKGQVAPMKGKTRPDMVGNTNGFKKGMAPWNKGLGTISSENEKARKTKQYREWRKAVFERDNYTCQECGERGGELNADHIKQFAYHPELRYDITNGQTLCVDCHRSTKTWGFRATNGVFNLASS